MPRLHKTVVMNVVGLTPGLLGSATPHLNALIEQGKMATLNPVLPAVTCSVQATFLTGCHPDEHGIVGNGWYFRDEHEIKFWRQSNRLIQRPKVWETARTLDPTFTCANLFWWFNMYAATDYAVTPRPIYLADGRKLPDIYTKPTDLRFSLQQELGQFPLFNFWGPNASILASAWIAEAAQRVEQRYSPTLTLLYLPHLDYCLQRYGPVRELVEQDVKAIDKLCGELIAYYQRRGAHILLLSEYGMNSVKRPIHMNRVLRMHGLLVVRQELGCDLLDPGASVAFAVADHQIAHVYVNQPERAQEVRNLLESVAGVAQVLGQDGKRGYHLDHTRAGDFVVVAEPDAWFTYYYWLHDRHAPDYARTVDIHRKPGYDPVELFLDPRRKLLQLNIAWKLLCSRLGWRTLLDVIPLDASLVRGSHGCLPTRCEDSPLVITQNPELLTETSIEATEVYGLILRHLTGNVDVNECPSDFCTT